MDAGRVEHAEFVAGDGVGEEFALDDVLPAHGGVGDDSGRLVLCADDGDVTAVGRGGMGSEGLAVAVFEVDLVGGSGGGAVVADLLEEGEDPGFEFGD